MKFYSIKKTQQLPISLEEAWAFFSTPHNLAKTCPAYIDFTVTTDKKDIGPIHSGQVITYSLKPLCHIRLKWMTEITHMNEGNYFIDEQRYGPYKLWQHKHSFKKIGQGTEMTDLVHYIMPFGFIGTIAHTICIKKRLEAIFEYRKQVLTDLFGEP